MKGAPTKVSINTNREPRFLQFLIGTLGHSLLRSYGNKHKVSQLWFVWLKMSSVMSLQMVYLLLLIVKYSWIHGPCVKEVVVSRGVFAIFMYFFCGIKKRHNIFLHQYEYLYFIEQV